MIGQGVGLGGEFGAGRREGCVLKCLVGSHGLRGLSDVVDPALM